MASNLKNLGYKVSTRDISWNDLVQRSWGSEFHAPDHDVYKFSNNRSFDSTDKTDNGFYNGGVEITSGLLIESASSRQYPDMYATVLTDESHNKILKD